MELIFDLIRKRAFIKVTPSVSGAVGSNWSPLLNLEIVDH
jgi:hypothetical protein